MTQPTDTQAHSDEPPAGHVGTASPPRRTGIVGWIVQLLVIALLAGGGYLGYRHLQQREATKADAGAKKGGRAVPVVTATARNDDVPLYIDSLGTVAPLATVTVRSRIDGEIMKINFTEGQQIKAGEVLVEIDPRQYELQLAQSEGMLAKDVAQLKQAQIDLERDRRLIASKNLAEQEYETQAALVKQLEGTIASDRAAVGNAKLQLAYCKITSPITGRIGLRKVDIGNYVRSADAGGIAVVTQLQPISIVFTILQDDIARVQHLNSKEPLKVEAMGRDLGSTLATGAISALDNQVDSASGTVKAKASFANDDYQMFPNQFLNVRLLVDVRKNAVVIPNAGVQHGPDFDFVYLLKEDETVELRKITIGPTAGNRTVVETGLEPGETIVTQGVDKLVDGAKVDSKAASKSGEKSKDKSGDKKGSGGGKGGKSGKGKPRDGKPTA